ncbi:murein biosynthesis integral membrane protein MurJ [soil metagenome]
MSVDAAEPPDHIEEESLGPTVAKAGGIMMSSQAMSRILGMLRNTVMAAMFGTALSTEAYNIATTIPDTLFMLVAGGGLSSAFIPVFSELLHQNKKKEAWKFFSVVVTVCSIAVTALIGIAWALAPWIANRIAGDKVMDGVLVGPEMVPRIVQMGRILLPAQFAFLIGSIFLGTLYSRKQFLAPAVAPNVYNVGIILGAFIGGATHFGIAGMAVGGLIGAMIGNIALPILFMSKAKSEYKPSLDLKAEGVKKFFILLAPVIFGFSLPSMVQLITTFFAGKYPVGANAVLYLAGTLMQAPSGIFGQSLALAAFPILAQYYANGKMDLYRDQMSRSLRTVIFLGLPSAAIMMALAPQIVHLLYGYGKAAKDGNLGDIAAATQVYSLSVFAWCVQPVLMRGYFSVHKTFVPVVIGTAMTALFIGMGYFCLGHGYSYLSLAWATDIAALLMIVILYVALEKTVGALDRPAILSTTAKSLIAATAMGAVAFLGSFALKAMGLEGRKLFEALGFLILCLVAGAVYVFVAHMLKMPETSYFDRVLAKVRRKK